MILLGAANAASREMRGGITLCGMPCGPGGRLAISPPPSRRASASQSEVHSHSADGGLPTPQVFLDVAEFKEMTDAMKAYDDTRETVIKRSREIQKASKAAIYCLHRHDMAEAHKQLVSAEAVIDDLAPLIAQDPSLRSGSFSAALEEYAEASVLRNFIQTGTVLPHRLLRFCDRDEYLGGLLDFAGELNRLAVARATKRDVVSVQHCREVLDALNGQFLLVNFRNGALRQKYDGLKYSLQKVENLLYELSLRETGSVDLTEIVDKVLAAADRTGMSSRAASPLGDGMPAEGRPAHAPPPQREERPPSAIAETAEREEGPAGGAAADASAQKPPASGGEWPPDDEARRVAQQ